MSTDPDKVTPLLTAIPVDDALLLEWQPGGGTADEAAHALQSDIFRRFHESGWDWLFRLGFAPATVALAESLDYWRRFAAVFVRELVLTPDLETLRGRVQVAPPEGLFDEIVANAPLAPGFELLNAALLESAWQGMLAAFKAAIDSYEGSVESFTHSLRPDLELAGKVFFHLVENKGEMPFAFLATYSTKIDATGAARHLPLKNALREFAEDNDKLLTLLGAVHRAAARSKLVAELLASGRIFHPLAMDSNRALLFLREVAMYESCGIRCRIPNWWTARATRVKVNVKIGGAKPAELGLQALLDCAPELRFGDTLITLEEARRLLDESEGLALVKNKWVEVDKQKLAQALAAYQKLGTLLADGMSMREAMGLLADSGAKLGEEFASIDVSMGEWLAETSRKLRNPELVRQVTPGNGFKATLRPYQRGGLNWLAFLDSLRLGGCLADDMGLGKTIQVLAFLSVIRQNSPAPSLLVVPASLMRNWSDEIARFLPDLRFVIAHGQSAAAIGRKATKPTRSKNGFATAAAAAFADRELVITTYGMVQRNQWLRDCHWHYVFLDEAQAIKNPGTRQTQAVKTLTAINRVVLTGTPVENHLGDLWSLFDFLNPGLLGNRAEFKRVSESAARDGDYARIRQVVSPYILRRLKTDKSVIDDLPEKIEMKVHAALAPKQIVLYRSLVEELKSTLDEAEGIQRRGLVLAYLMKFKQVCNHPDQYNGAGDFAEADSGKFACLRDICATIMAKHERVLVFSQFREMAAPLDHFLAQVFGHRGLVFHGGLNEKKRHELVSEFQNTRDYIPYMVLSLKTAGVGLNLTRANHVIHFDRWWNPAVENQATDRAFRIGQKHNVLVHKMICRETVEDKIDQMISAKTSLANEIVAATNEKWLTEMSNSELADLFTLGVAP